MPVNSELSHLARRYPEVASWLAASQDFLDRLPGLRRRLETAFEAADAQQLDRSVTELIALKALPEAVEQHQVEALWSSYFYGVFLEAIGFYPPATINPLAEVPPGAAPEQLPERARQDEKMFPEHDFWRWALHKSYCEYFLEPLLRPGPLEGLDLACGWGRATFSLRNFEQRRLHCCDRAGPHLELLQRLAGNAGLEQFLQIHQGQIESLPLASDSLDFVLAFDIFELLTDPVLDLVLSELLRCARPGALLYSKVTLNAYRPGLGQVQQFDGAGWIERFCSARAHGKRLRVRRSAAALPEHKTFQVV